MKPSQLGLNNLVLVFSLDQTYTVDHVVFMSGFHHKLNTIQSIRATSFVFDVKRIYRINHVVILSGFCHSR